MSADARGSIVLRVIADLFRAEIADRSMTLAAQAFTSILPVLIAFASLGQHQAVDDIADWVARGRPSGSGLASAAPTRPRSRHAPPPR